MELINKLTEGFEVSSKVFYCIKRVAKEGI
jgi:hypothetical protein